MIRSLISLGLVAVLMASGAWAQTTDDQGLQDRPPQENVRSGYVQQRAPSTWIDAARARHNSLISERLTAPRFGERAVGTIENSNSASSSGSSITDLISLVGSLGSSSDLLGSVSGLLGGTTNSGSQTSTTGSSTTTSGSQYTIADLLALRDAMIGSSKSLDGGVSDTTTSTKEPTDRSQTTDTRKFHVRLRDSLLQTFFTALVVGLQTNDFVTILKDGLRPLLTWPAFGGTDSDGTDSTNGDGDSTNGGGDTIDSIVQYLTPSVSGVSGSTRLA
ncbi:MAG: hypothetical protein KKB50_08680 [Planctomycetes bacterium]|nr:hypothetical protein [Planctomycetota bacterium]